MKKILLYLTAATLLFSACSKDDDNSDYVSNTWTVNGIQHSVVNTARIGGNFTISVNDGSQANAISSLTFAFSSAPVSGMYTIVDIPTQPTEVAIVAQEGSPINIYRSTAAETRKVAINVNDGKATIYLQGASLQGILPGSGNIEATASIRENN